MNRGKIKKKPLKSEPQSSLALILEPIRFIYFATIHLREVSHPISVTGHWRILSYEGQYRLIRRNVKESVPRSNRF